MMNIFEKTYAQVQEAHKAYDAATDEAGKEAARTLYHEATAAIEALGSTACRIWREYEVARGSGNIYLDISEVVWDKDVEALISCMRDNGIDHFTFSSTWSSAVETAWLFLQNSATNPTEYILFLEMVRFRKGRYGKQQCSQVPVNWTILL